MASASTLGCLILVGRTYGLNLTIEQLVRDNLLGAAVVGAPELIECARRAGLRCSVLALDWPTLLKLDAALPAIILMQDGSAAVLDAVELADGGPRLRLRDPRAPDDPWLLDQAGFVAHATCETILIRPSHAQRRGSEAVRLRADRRSCAARPPPPHRNGNQRSRHQRPGADADRVLDAARLRGVAEPGGRNLHLPLRRCRRPDPLRGRLQRLAAPCAGPSHGPDRPRSVGLYVRSPAEPADRVLRDHAGRHHHPQDRADGARPRLPHGPAVRRAARRRRAHRLPAGDVLGEPVAHHDRGGFRRRHRELAAVDAAGVPSAVGGGGGGGERARRFPVADDPGHPHRQDPGARPTASRPVGRAHGPDHAAAARRIRPAQRHPIRGGSPGTAEPQRDHRDRRLRRSRRPYGRRGQRAAHLHHAHPARGRPPAAAVAARAAVRRGPVRGGPCGEPARPACGGGSVGSWGAGASCGPRDVSNLRFRYRGAVTPALKDVSFEIAPGMSFGIMGRSGSGKTTITRLLQRLHADYTGSIRVDGVDVREYDVDHLRASLGVVLQENFLFSGTIRDNIAAAKSDASLDEVIAAARLSGAEEFIDKLPGGYETMIYEGSPNLSGGQRQRIAIARALITNPKILILDEATSALDAESEAIVNANLRRIAAGRTTIVISHRLSSLVPCDAIMVLDGGEVHDIGKHHELLDRCDIYSGLWARQNQHMQGPIALPDDHPMPRLTRGARG